MTPRVTWAVTTRVLTQLRRDRRTLAMLLALPCAVLALLWWMVSDVPARAGQDPFGALAPALLALIPFTVMFLVTSVTTLRERTSGTLERFLALPTGRGDLVVGYGLAFGLVATAQSALAVLLSVSTLGLEVSGSVLLLVVVAVADALLGTALGLLVSAFARTEFQAVQFMPVLVVPQILLCGLFVDRDRLPPVLGAVSDALPLSWAVEAMTAVVAGTGGAGRDVAVVLGWTAVSLVLGALTLRRRTA